MDSFDLVSLVGMKVSIVNSFRSTTESLADALLSGGVLGISAVYVDQNVHSCC